MDRIIKIYRKIVDLRPSGFWLGFVVGLIYFSYVFWWLWSLYPFTSLGLGGISSFFIIFYFLIITVSVFSFFWGLSFWLILKTRNKQTSLFPFFAASVFVLAQYLQSLFYSIIWYGRGGSIGPFWTIGNPAYFFTNPNPLIKTASVWGIYGVDFILVFVIVSTVLIIKKKSYKPILGLGLIIFLVAIVNIRLNMGKQAIDNVSVQKINLTLIQTQLATDSNGSAEDILSDFSKKVDLMKTASKETSSRIIVLPESSNFSKTLSVFIDPYSAKNFLNKLSEKEILLVDNVRTQDEDSFKSSTLFINSQEGLKGFSEKMILTPVGETLPYSMKWLSFFLNRARNVFVNSREFSKGDHFEMLDINNQKALVLVCSEVFSPQSARGDYGFILALDSLGIFKGSQLLENELLSALRLRAIENAKPAVLASNFGHSYVINNEGRIDKMTESLGYQLLTAAIVPNKERTWYNRLGDWPILLLSLVIFGLGLKFLKHANQG